MKIDAMEEVEIAGEEACLSARVIVGLSSLEWFIGRSSVENAMAWASDFRANRDRMALAKSTAKGGSRRQTERYILLIRRMNNLSVESSGLIN